MFSRLAYYGFVYPVSHLPLPIMYLFIDFFYLLLITIIPYRRNVVRTNIENSFPDLTSKEKKKIERKFYRHLASLLAEGTKNLTISKKALLRRMKVRNPEVLEVLYKKNKSVLLVSGHYNNWEWLITAQNMLFSHQAVGIGMPLSNKFWDKQLNARRSRFGMKIINSNNLRAFYQDNNECIATLVLSDQSPGDSRKSYWMQFLNQPTPVLFGAEMMAHKYDHAVVYFVIHQVKRGYYEIELKLISDNPRELNWGEITEAHTKSLEKDIIKAPEYWIWSHKRWKRSVPDDLDLLKKEQKEKFIKNFKG
jgi:KDO2-lipid IV(A) lauroyltransferase